MISSPVLFERESLRWDYQSSAEARKAFAKRANASSRSASCSIDSTPGLQRLEQRVYCASDTGVHMSVGHDIAPTLTTMDARGACFINPPYCSTDSSTLSVGHDLSPTLTAHDGKSACFVNSPGFAVRRLTAIECERLQGFPDGYTDVPWRGAEHAPDSKRYKALGNSMAVPVMRWIGEGIELVSNSGS